MHINFVSFAVYPLHIFFFSLEGSLKLAVGGKESCLWCLVEWATLKWPILSLSLLIWRLVLILLKCVRMPKALCQVLSCSKHSVNVSCYYWSLSQCLELEAHSRSTSMKREPRSREGSELPEAWGSGRVGRRAPSPLYLCPPIPHFRLPAIVFYLVIFNPWA